MDELGFLVLVFGVGNLVFFGLLLLFKKIIYFWDVKNCVDVEVFFMGENSLKSKFVNCRKVKKNTDSGFESYDLIPFPTGKGIYDYNSRYVVARTDGKDTIKFVDIQGKKIPFMPNAEIDEAGNITSIVKDYDWTYSTENMDKIVEYTIRDNIQKIKTGSKLKSGLSGLQIILIGISVLLIVGLVIYWLMAKTGGAKP